MTSFVASQLDYVFFTYGLMLVLLGAVGIGATRTGRLPVPWWFLAAYGLSAGMAEWLELWAYVSGDSAGFLLARTVVKWVAFASLLEFARRVHRLLHGSTTGPWLHAALAATTLVLVAVFGPATLPTAIRLGTALPAAIWTAVLFRQAADRGDVLGGGAPAWRARILGSLCFGLYAVLSGIVVPEAPFLPAGWPTAQAFLRDIGIPVQVARAASVAGITFAVWSLAVALSPSGDVVRKRRLLFWVISGTFGATLVAGWVFTDALGRLHDRDVEADAQSAADRIIGRIQVMKMVTADEAATVASIATRSGMAGAGRVDAARLDVIGDSVVHSDGQLTLYVMDAAGTTISSTNRNQPQSFLGKNFSARAYFKDALAGGRGSFLGVGTVSGVAGYYSSAPLRDPSGAVVGVVAAKHNLGTRELGPPGAEHAFIVDPEGTVVVSNEASVVSRRLWGGDARPDGAKDFASSFRGLPLGREPAPGTSWSEAGGTRHVAVRTYLEGSDWSLVLLKGETTTATNRVLGIAITLLFSLLVLAAFVAVQRQFGTEVDLVVKKSRAEAKAHEMARAADTDALTGLMNRMGFNGAISREVARARRHDQPMAMLILDLDHFKSVNDTHGHSAGDRVLAGVARLLEANVRESDLVARWGGEEFVVVAPMTAAGGAGCLAEKLRALLAAAPTGPEGPVTASIGVAQLRPGDTIEGLLQRADAALYRAKMGGRNRVEQDDEAPSTAENSPSQPARAAPGGEAAAPRFPPVGFEPIDRDHRALGTRFAALESAVSGGDVGEAIAEMRLVAAGLEVHFAREEDLMRALRYRQLERHAEAHATFVKDAWKCLEELETSGITSGSRRWVMNRMGQWFRYHVEAHDARLAPFLAGRGVTGWSIPIADAAADDGSG